MPNIERNGWAIQGDVGGFGDCGESNGYEL
jgi:hypothetical protein